MVASSTPERPRPIFELPDKSAPALLGLAKSHLNPENFPLSALAYADRHHRGC